MSRLWVLLDLIMLTLPANAQNQISNPGFENYTNCPMGVAQILVIQDWANVFDHTGSADYFNTCTQSTLIGVPNNFWGTEMPASGEGYIGLNLIYERYPEFREYVQTQFVAPLVAGNQYELSFKYSLADNSQYTTNALGFYFSHNAVIGSSTWDPLPVTPQISVSTDLDQTNGWTTITLIYTASGGEEFLTIGNFLDYNSTPKTNLPGAGAHPGAYIYLDDFSVKSKSCTVTLGDDKVLCEGESITYDVGRPNSTYLWQDGSTLPSFTITEPGTYWVEVTTGTCVSRDEVVVDFKPAPKFELGDDISMCSGEARVLQALVDNASFLWSDESTKSYINVSKDGMYWVEVSLDGCTAKDTVYVEVLQAPEIDLGEDTTICIGEELLLDIYTPAALYNWYDNSNLSSKLIKNDGVYWAKITVEGCDATDTIQVSTDNCNCHVYVPNSFTPNKDGDNDYFFPVSNCDFEQYELTIYNQWGEAVFMTNHSDVHWNGQSRGSYCPDGTYLYYLTYQFEDYTKLKYGTVTLLK